MTPINIIKLFGLKAVPYVMALVGALALIALAKDAQLFAPGALLTLLLDRYEDFLELLLAPVEPILVEHLGPHWPGESPFDPSPFWRRAFALGAMAAIGVAAPFYRRRSTFLSILVGAVGLVLAAAAALAADQFAPNTPESRLGYALAILALGALALIVGFGRARNEAGRGASFWASWRDYTAASNVGWTVLGGVIVAAMLVGLDASDYSGAIAAWLWFV